MDATFTPQFKLEELYITPFTGKRYFDAQTGKAIYEPVERNMTPTGVHVLDTFLQCVCTSKRYTQRSLKERLGVPKAGVLGAVSPAHGYEIRGTARGHTSACSR